LIPPDTINYLYLANKKSVQQNKKRCTKTSPKNLGANGNPPPKPGLRGVPEDKKAQTDFNVNISPFPCRAERSGNKNPPIDPGDGNEHPPAGDPKVGVRH